MILNKIFTKYYVYSIFLLLPAFLLLFSLSLKEAQGPYFKSTLYDPDYVYLLGSLNAADLNSSYYVDHPGTIVQMIGGIVLRFHTLDYSALEKDVLARPEFYLSRLNFFIVLANVIMLSAVGIMSYCLTGHVIPGLFIQITPFLSTSILMSLTRFNPEPFLIFSGLLLTLFVLIKSAKATEVNDDHRKFILIFSITGGFGLAAKITFLPLLIIPAFLFRKCSSIIKYVSFTGIAFLLFLIPYYKRVFYALDWWWNIAIHTGMHSAGQIGVFDYHELLPNIQSLFRNEALFMYVLLFLIAFITINLWIPKLRRLALNSIVFRVLAGIAIADLLGLIMILKHFSFHYLIPGLSLTGLVIGLIYIYLNRLNKEKTFNKKIIDCFFVFLFIISIFFSYYQLPSLTGTSLIKDAKLSVYQNMFDEHKDSKKIFYYGSTSKHYALYFGCGWAGINHADILESIYGKDVYFYRSDTGTFHNWHQEISIEEMVSNLEGAIMFGPNKTVLHGDQSIMRNIQKALAGKDMKVINTVPDAQYDTIFKFEKVKSAPLKK